MRVGFYSHYDKDPERQVYLDILAYNGIEVIKTNINEDDFWNQVNSVDAFILKWGNTHDFQQIALNLIPIIEQKMKGRIFPDMATCWHYDDKIKQDYLLKEFGFPFVESWIFYDKNRAITWAETASYPVVFKLAKGSGSWNVFLVHSLKQANELIKLMFSKGKKIEATGIWQKYLLYNRNLSKLIRYYATKCTKRVVGGDYDKYWMKQKNYIYFQKFCPNNVYDTRVTTAGKRAHAFRRFVRKNDFRASGSDEWSLDPDKIDMQMVKTALEISSFFGYQSMAYDFVYDENKEPRIVEISYAYGRAGYPDFMNGYWDAELNWQSGRYWPQCFELEDLLGISGLKLPPIMLENDLKKAKIR